MVEHLHVQQFACLDDGAGYGHIIRAGGGISAGIFYFSVPLLSGICSQKHIMIFKQALLR